jgi:nicotinamide mononucleotide transporter
MLILEVLAVICSLLYTVLITEGIIWCWLFALLSAGLYLIICAQKRIYAEMVLQAFYLTMAIYGYQHWGAGLAEKLEPLPLIFHAGIITSGLALVLVSGYLLKRYTPAAKPLVDSFTTVFSVFATLLQINLFPENWLYFIVIDAVSVYLYLSRKLYLTALLFLIYTALAINGYLAWI